MDSRSGSADISEDCGELSRLRRERHRLLLRVSGGRISVAASSGGKRQTETSVTTSSFYQSGLFTSSYFLSFGGRAKRKKMAVTRKATTIFASPAIKKGENKLMEIEDKRTLPLWFLRLTCELRNDGRRVLVQVIYTPSDGVGGHRHPWHDHPAVV